MSLWPWNGCVPTDTHEHKKCPMGDQLPRTSEAWVEDDSY